MLFLAFLRHVWLQWGLGVVVLVQKLHFGKYKVGHCQQVSGTELYPLQVGVYCILWHLQNAYSHGL